MFFGMFFNWKSTVKKLHSGNMTVQQFVNVNENKKLYYSTPFIADENGGVPNALQTKDSDIAYFPVFTTKDGLKAHMTAMGNPQYMFFKGELKNILISLDFHKITTEWGMVIDPASPTCVEIPPQVRVQPKCLR